MQRRTKHHGFSIIELIVTTSILGLMLFLVNQLFNDTSIAVTTSVQTSKVIAASRSINEQFTDDADAMLGPGVSGNGGYIVIIQQRLPSVKMLNPVTLEEYPNNVPLRSDQLLFIRDAEGLKSMTPATDSSYRTNFIGMPSDRAKVWIGHAQRSQPDGTPLTGSDTELGGSSALVDSVGNRFILARQAMLFNPTNSGTNTKLAAAPAGFTYATNSAYNSAVNNVTGFTGTAQTYKGLTDITAQDYGASSTAGTLLYQLTDTSTVADHTTNYLNTLYPVAANRLRVNPSPSVADTDYASWAIAQGHAILAQACSEVIIDFAADLDGDGEIDRNGTGANAPIFWYDSLSNVTFGTGAGQAQWRQQSPATDFPQPWDNVNLGTNARAFIFRVDDDEPYDEAAGGTQAHSYWPYLIRVRYRLHDMRGRLTSNYPAAARDGVDNDGDGTTDASNGDINEDRISGRWFERIIQVPRP